MQATTIPLSKPVPFAGELVSALELAPLRAEHMFDMPTGREPNVGEILAMAGAASGQPIAVMKQLAPADIGAVLQWAGEQLDPFQATGETSSGVSPASSAGDQENSGG